MSPSVLACSYEHAGLAEKFSVVVVLDQQRGRLLDIPLSKLNRDGSGNYLARSEPKGILGRLQGEHRLPLRPISITLPRASKVSVDVLFVEPVLGVRTGDRLGLTHQPVDIFILEEDLEVAYNQMKPQLALYIGGMGAKGKNFYFDLACRYGFEAEAETIQDLYLAGNRGEAMMAVPNELVDAVALIGSKDRIKDRVQMWKDSPITTMNITAFDVETVRLMAELVL